MTTVSTCPTFDTSPGPVTTGEDRYGADAPRGLEPCAFVYVPKTQSVGVWHTAAIRDCEWVKEQMLVAPLAALHPVVPCHWPEAGI